MPKKVITRRQRKAAEAKRKAEEDARLDTKTPVGVGGDMVSAEAGATLKLSTSKTQIHGGNPLPEDQASTLTHLKLSRRQKKKAKRRTKKNLELSTTNESDMRPSSSSSLSKKSTTLVDTISKINSDAPSTWYDNCKPQQAAAASAPTTLEPKPSTEQSNRVVPFGTRLCRRIARRFRPIPEKGVHHHQSKPEVDENQPTLRQLAALNRVIMNKKNTQFQEEVLETLQQCGKNQLANIMHPPEQHEATSELKIEKQAAEILEKYLQNYQDENESKATAVTNTTNTNSATNTNTNNNTNTNTTTITTAITSANTTTAKRQKKSKLRPTRFPQAAISKRQERGFKRDVDNNIIAASLPQPPMDLEMVPVEQPPPPLKIVGHTGYFILSGTNEQLAQQFYDLEAQHVCIRKCLLLLAGMTEKVEQQLGDLDQNRQQILNHMHSKFSMLAPKRQRRQKRPQKHVQVDKAGRANANRKGNPKKQRGTILAPAAERSAATC